ncbi:hypothetical protein D3C73_1158160 [compost metagenome]
MASGLLEEEERRLRVDRAHLVVLRFADLQHRLLQHFADGVDRDVRATDRGNRVGEQPPHCRGRGQIGLQRHGLCTCGLHGCNGRLGIGLGSSAVVVDDDGLGALLGEVAGDQPAEVLGTAGDQHGLALDTVVGHGIGLGEGAAGLATLC